MKSDIFPHQNYGDVLRSQITAGERSWGMMTRLSEAANCQKSHLSRVLRGETHLTLEQANGLCEFWQLSENEVEYFMTMVERERAGDRVYRQRLQRKLDSLRRTEEDLSTRLKHPTLEIQEQDYVYYSAWWMQAIHIAVSIPELQTAEKISQRLALPLSVVTDTLTRLETSGLVSFKNDRWTFSSSSMHLPKDSFLISLHHKNWRERAVFNSQINAPDSLHYTVIQSISQHAFDKIKHLLLKAIDDYSTLANPSKEEEIVCLACDFFKV